MNRTTPPLRSRWTLAVLLLAVAGCAVGPDPKRPVTVADEAERYVHQDSQSAAESPPIGRWWEGFADPVTEELVLEALEGNTDLRVAVGRVLEAEALLKAAGGDLYPQVGFGANSSRTKNSMVLPGIGRTGIYSTTYSADLSVSWQIDLFGRLRRTREAAWGDLLASRADREAVWHTVAASVVRGRIRVATLQQQLHLARTTVDSWRNTLDTVERRYRAGIVGPLDVRMARENLATAEMTVPLIRQNLAGSRHSLDVLLGRRPGTGPPLEERLVSLPDLEPIPLGLPASLLDRRPDLMAAEARLAASTSRVGVAMASLFPSLTLTGIAGGRSDELSDLLSMDGLVYSAVTSLLQPIFQGGKLKGQLDAAEARQEQAAAAYAGAILNALREVEDALVRENAARERMELVEVRVEEARGAAQLADERYRRGVEKLLVLLDTERRRRVAENEEILVRGDLWNARVDLFLALGGDWPNPERESEGS